MNPGRQIAPAPRSEEGAPARYERYEQTNPLQRMNSMPSAAGSSEGEQYPSSLTTSLNTSSSSRKPLVAKAGPRRQGKPSSSSSESHGHRKKRGGGRITTVAATVLFVLGVVLLVETMVVVAYVAAPLVGLMRTMETTIDTMNTPDYHVKLEFDAGDKLMTSGASVIGPLLRKLSPSDDEAFRTQSTANDTAFVDWCQQVRSLTPPLLLCRSPLMTAADAFSLPPYLSPSRPSAWAAMPPRSCASS